MMPPDGFTGRVQWGGHSRLGLGLGLGPEPPNLTLTGEKGET